MNLIKEFYTKTKIDFKNLYSPTKTPLNWVKIFYKNYPRFQEIKLTSFSPQSSLEKILFNRASQRDFNKTSKFDGNILSKLIYFSIGQKKNERRMYPSAGARYAIESYFILNNVSGIDDGLYHYKVKNHSLELLDSKNYEKIKKEILNDNNIENNVTVILTVVLNRLFVKYNNISYRLSLLEAGHIAQNFYLLATSYAVKCCSVGGFHNDKVSDILDVSDEEIPLYVINLGL